METSDQDEFLAFNHHLAVLVAADVPLDLGLSGDESTALLELDRIGSTVLRRLNRGESLSQALEGDDAEVPAEFRGAIQFGLRAGNIASALPGSGEIAESVDNSRRAFESSLVYPLVICVLAYLGLIGFSTYLVPTLLATYADLKVSPGAGLQILRAFRVAMPYWVVLLPCLLIVGLVWWLRSNRRASSRYATIGALRWLPGTSRIVFQERCSRFAESLADLLEKNVPLNEALPIAGELSGDVNLLAGAISAAGMETDSQPADDHTEAQRFPPFLRWAIWQAEPSSGREQALRIAARFYNTSAQQRAQRQRTLLPIGTIVFIGGTVTLLYGLALFIPVVELLHTLAQS